MGLTDWSARPLQQDIVPTNITELLRNSDKIKLMDLLGCDEKYKNGQASDFEWFAEWERILPLCPGHGMAAIYEEEKKLLGIDLPETTAERWRKGNAHLPESVSPIDPSIVCLDLNRFVSESITECADYPALRDAALRYIKNGKNREMHLFLTLSDSIFLRPSPYLANRVFDQVKSDEKWNSKEGALLFAQLLIDLSLAARKAEIRTVPHLWAATSYEKVLLSYLSEHRLLEGEVRLRAYTEGMTDELLSLCGSRGAEFFVLPEPVFRPADLGASLIQTLRALGTRYPLGGLRFGGVETDAPLFHACHRLIAWALIDLCPTEQSASAVALSFFKD